MAIYVLQHDRGWLVQRNLADPPSLVIERKQEALKLARAIAEREGCDILVHDSKGKTFVKARRRALLMGRPPCS